MKELIELRLTIEQAAYLSCEDRGCLTSTGVRVLRLPPADALVRRIDEELGQLPPTPDTCPPCWNSSGAAQMSNESDRS